MAPLLGADNADRRDGDEEGEWTRVARKRNARSAWPTKTPSFLVPRNPSRGRLSVADIAAHHERVRSHWRSQPAFQHIADVFSKYAATHAPITQAICLGNGSFDPTDVELAQGPLSRPHVQTAAFLDLVKLFGMLFLRRWRLRSANPRSRNS